LKKEGFGLYALEEHERAVNIHQAARSTYDTVLAVGNEITGVDPELLELCDNILYIPMRGEKKSFNVAIAFGIAAYALSQK
jgi:tRNA G18 (ribose-2'-O)-methylase SpoU